LPNDYYHFDPVRKLLSGEKRGLQFRLGDPVRVQVLRASLEDRKIDFRLVADAQSAASTQQSAKREPSLLPPAGKGKNSNGRFKSGNS
jgi:ribonuclease R